MDFREAWVALNLIEGVGPVRARSLLEHFGEAPKVLAASKSELLRVRNIGDDVVEHEPQFAAFFFADEPFCESKRKVTSSAESARFHIIGSAINPRKDLPKSSSFLSKLERLQPITRLKSVVPGRPG